MTTKSNCIQYTCIAKGTTVLAEVLNSKDADLAALAAKCLEKNPPNHEIFSHTVRGKTYTFLIDDPIIYFAIYIDSLEKSKGIAFLRSVKERFDKFKVGRLVISSRCFQDEFSPVIHELLPPNEYVEPPMTRKKSFRHNRGGSLDSMGKNLRGDYSSSSLKRRSAFVNEEDDSIVSQRNKELFRGDAGQKEGKRGWRKHVWFVLSMDVIICCILFIVWLWI